MTIESDPFEAKVPCNGCTACCRAEVPPRRLVLRLDLGDDPADYECESTVERLTGKPCFALKNQENGDCIYLDRETGCTIYERRPAPCRLFDCRQLYLALIEQSSRGQRRRWVKHGILSADVLKAARQRLHTLEDYPRR